jgi:hypothetical protein
MSLNPKKTNLTASPYLPCRICGANQWRKIRSGRGMVAGGVAGDVIAGTIGAGIGAALSPKTKLECMACGTKAYASAMLTPAAKAESISNRRAGCLLVVIGLVVLVIIGLIVTAINGPGETANPAYRSGYEVGYNGGGCVFAFGSAGCGTAAQYCSSANTENSSVWYDGCLQGVSDENDPLGSNKYANNSGGT